MSATTAQSDAAEAAVRALYEDLLGAWNRRDAPAYAALFAPDGALIGFDGSQVPGAEVEDHLTPIFADHPTASYVWQVREVRVPAEGVALLRAIVGMVPPGGTDLNPAANAVQSLVAEHRSGAWRVVLFHNTPAQHHGHPERVEQHTDELRRVLRRSTTDR
ncbi:SgcJ/EcaC family oxidoreductase [Streptomyces sp. MP131-18]|uniref:SgcJ/EcaC family oxidoreductase n=1 Tax=Streptomyces sp. MP131-18 TaxID=1857892 RepID=UPI00097CA0EC|nr:SgcJ/EcaC family oxidoreductase [Streptomyces sp. MP131-18]